MRIVKILIFIASRSSNNSSEIVTDISNNEPENLAISKWFRTVPSGGYQTSQANILRTILPPILKPNVDGSDRRSYNQLECFEERRASNPCSIMKRNCMLLNQTPPSVKLADGLHQHCCPQECSTRDANNRAL